MISIGQIKGLYEQIKPILENENVKRYGNMLIQKGKNGAKKILGHLETQKKTISRNCLKIQEIQARFRLN